jgi:hypothetical protein
MEVYGAEAKRTTVNFFELGSEPTPKPAGDWGREQALITALRVVGLSTPPSTGRGRAKSIAADLDVKPRNLCLLSERRPLVLSPLSSQKRQYTCAPQNGLDGCDNDIGLWNLGKTVNSPTHFSMSPARGPLSALGCTVSPNGRRNVNDVGNQTLCPRR